MHGINKTNVFYETFVNLTAATVNVFQKYTQKNKYILFIITEQLDITFQEFFAHF